MRRCSEVQGQIRLSLEAVENRAAPGATGAIDMARDWTPHVILMDLSMPYCNRFEATRALRQDPRTAGIAIVAHTALDEVEVRRHLTDQEFDGYI